VCVYVPVHLFVPMSQFTCLCDYVPVHLFVTMSQFARV
jgi:hypothetical protein